MKQNDIKDNEVTKLSESNLENLFHVYETSDNEYYYNVIRTTNFPDDLDPTLFLDYVAMQKDTWALIAYKHYSDVKLWWLVCSVNGIIDATKQPKPGQVLKILRASVVRDVMFEIREA